MPTDVWGLLLKEDALRDFFCGQDVQALGIKTNYMECVLELDYPIYIPQTDKVLKPILLQYNASPCRAAHAVFSSTLNAYTIVKSVVVVYVFLSYHSTEAEEDSVTDNE